MGRIKSEAGAGGLKRGPKPKAKQDVVKTGFDGPLEAPTRKTATIYKQPVTLVVSSKPDSTDAPLEKIKKYASDPRERPMPLFWSKCFEQSSAMLPIHKCDKISTECLERSDEYIRVKPSLPDDVKPYCALIKPKESLISYASALTQPHSVGVVGQKEQNPQKRFFDNPFLNANPDQPLVVGITKVDAEQIAQQEAKVLDARKRLQELRNSFTFTPSSTNATT